MSNPFARPVSRRVAAPWRQGAPGALLALAIASLAVAAVGIEGVLSFRKSLGEGRSLGEATFLFLRYFTILTNIAVAGLMLLTLARRLRVLAPAGLYAAVTVYASVTGIAYELLLRRLWSPRGMQFLTDLTMHDIVPALTLVYWIAFAPKHDLGRRDAGWLLVFPAGYFAVTLAAGALGAGYPYDFLDAATLGYPVVLAIAGAFLTSFYALGLLLVGLARLPR